MNHDTDKSCAPLPRTSDSLAHAAFRLGYLQALWDVLQEGGASRYVVSQLSEELRDNEVADRKYEEAQRAHK